MLNKKHVLLKTAFTSSVLMYTHIAFSESLENVSVMAQSVPTSQNAQWLKSHPNTRPHFGKGYSASTTTSDSGNVITSAFIAGGHSQFRNPSATYHSKGTRELAATGVDFTLFHIFRAGLSYFYGDADTKAYTINGKLLTRSHTVSPFVSLTPHPNLTFHVRSGFSSSRSKIKAPAYIGVANSFGRFLSLDATVHKRFDNFEPSLRVGYTHSFSNGKPYTLSNGSAVSRIKLETQTMQVSVRTKFYATEAFVPYVTLGVDPMTRKSHILKAKSFTGYHMGGGANVFKIGDIAGGIDYLYSQSPFSYRTHAITATVIMKV